MGRSIKRFCSGGVAINSPHLSGPAIDFNFGGLVRDILAHIAKSPGALAESENIETSCMSIAALSFRGRRYRTSYTNNI